MEGMESPIELKTLGRELHWLRRTRGMSVVRLAAAMGKPAWLLDLIEHAGDAPVADLCTLLSRREIESVQQAVTRLQSMKQKKVFYPLPAEHTFYLPVTLSAASLCDAVDQLMILAVEDPDVTDNRRQLLRQSVVSVSQLACLLQARYDRMGDEEKAKRCLRGFRKHLQARLQHCD